MTSTRWPSIALCGGLLAALPLHAQLFDFEATPLGTVSPFAIPGVDVTAGFHSAAGGVFAAADEHQLSPLGFERLAGHVLLETGASASALRISFSRPLTAIWIDFGLDAPDGHLSLAAFRGTRYVGPSMALGEVRTGHVFAEGTLYATFVPIEPIGAVRFDAVELTSGNARFAIDNVRVVLATPEPAALSLLAAGIAALALGVWRAGRDRDLPIRAPPWRSDGSSGRGASGPGSAT